MKSFNGRVAFDGYVISNSYVYNPNSQTVEHSFTNTDQEFARFVVARSKAVIELNRLYDSTLKKLGEEEAILFQTHKLMAEDLDFEDAVKEAIGSGLIAEEAVKVAASQLSNMFKMMDDEYMKARASDVLEVGNTISDIIAGKNKAFELEKPCIVVCDDLPSSTLMKFDREMLLGLVLIHGNLNSHVSILAKALEIPTVVALEGMSIEDVKNGDEIILNAVKGHVIVSPDEATIKIFQNAKKEYDEETLALKQYIGQPSVSKDGFKLKIYANITSSIEVENVNRNDAEGVGLFRSEFIYLDSKDYPTEDEQFKYYKEVVSKMNGKEVIIRTLDIGADKKIDYFNLPKEENPALGYRSIRICRDRPELFLTQLRALYRASNYGKLSIMVPMIVSLEEVFYVKEMCRRAQENLTSRGIPFNSNVKIGIMIETPSAAVISDLLAKYVDFFSIGTNDLSQYTLACDRLNPMLNKTFSSYNPSILRLIKMTVDNAHEAGIICGMCGELAHDEKLLPFLIGIHIDELSCSAAYCLKVRKFIKEIDSKTVDLNSYLN